MKRRSIKAKIIIITISTSLLIIYLKTTSTDTLNINNILIEEPMEAAALRSFDIQISSLGELEAERSTSIISLIRGDWGKVIYLVADGKSVNQDELLVKFDPTPFEEHIEELSRKIKDEENKIASLKQAHDWEIYQATHEASVAEIELEFAELELKKVTEGDTKIEESRLKAAMSKALTAFEEIKNFSTDLKMLEAEGFLNAIEMKQAEKKLIEEEEAYLTAKLQYDAFINHVLPLQLKKAQATLKRCMNKCEEAKKSGTFKISRSQLQIDQVLKEIASLKYTQKTAQEQLHLSEIKAPNAGMVVLKEDFRHGQRRKPRIGDVLLKNQSILDLPDLQRMLVKTKVREVDLYKVAIGTPVTVEVDAYPHSTFAGSILSIGVLAVSDAQRNGEEKFFEVIVGLDKGDERLRPGMTARATIHAGHLADSLTVPIQAVFEFAKKNYCFVKHHGSYIAKQVETGLCNENWIHIKEGLEPTETVLLSFPPMHLISNANEITQK